MRRAGSSAVRILAGRWKGRRLDVSGQARPTSGRAREALFDILQDSVVGIRVLDLYAGSGAIGLEALSRGAAEAVFVESDRRALESNIERLRPDAETARILPGDARRATEMLAREGRQFDFVFADPPYESGPGALSESLGELVAPGGRLVVQTDSNGEAPEIAGVIPAGRRAYGRNVFWLFERDAAGGA